MNNKQKLIRFVCTFGITVLILLMTKQIDYVLKEDINPAGFTDFNEARIDYMDYPHVSYSENPEVFEQYGWDENLESLVSDWCFLDDRVTTEAFVGIYEVEGENCQTTFFTPLVSLLEGDNYAKYLTYCFVGVALLGELYICLNGLFISQINFFFMSNLGGSLILLLFLIYRGRLPLRAYLIVVMSMILISCLLMLKTRAYGEKNAKSEFVWRLSLIVLLILAIPCFLHNYDEKLVQRKLSDIEACNAIDEYMRENNQNIYITDVDAYNNINPFSQTSYNHFWWGDSTYYSDYYYRQLQMNGLTELNMETFKRDDVYFITNASNENYNDNVHRLLECLKEYGGVRVEKVDCIDGVRDVYKFIFEE